MAHRIADVSADMTAEGPRGLAPRSTGRILWQVLTAATPVVPLERPAVPSDLPDLPPLPRLCACLHLFALDLEYALSPGGQLRGLARAVCRVSLALGLVSLGLAAVLACASAALAVALVVAGQLVVLLERLLQAMLLLAALLALGFLLLLAVRLMSRGGPNSGGVYRR